MYCQAVTKFADLLRQKFNMYCYTVKKVADLTCYLTKSQRTDTGQPVPVLTLYNEVSGWSATSVTMYKSLVWLDQQQHRTITSSLALWLRLPPHLKVADLWFDSCVHWDFSRLSHTSDLTIGTPVATLPGAWRYRVSAGTGRPSVYKLWLGGI